MLSLHQNLDKFIQTKTRPLRFKNASEFQGESAADFNFDENKILFEGGFAYAKQTSRFFYGS